MLTSILIQQERASSTYWRCMCAYFKLSTLVVPTNESIRWFWESISVFTTKTRVWALLGGMYQTYWYCIWTDLKLSTFVAPTNVILGINRCFDEKKRLWVLLSFSGWYIKALWIVPRKFFRNLGRLVVFKFLWICLRSCFL